MSSKSLSKLLCKNNKANSTQRGRSTTAIAKKGYLVVTGQLAPLRFDPWSTRTLIFRTLIYPSQLAIHTVSLLGQLAP